MALPSSVGPEGRRHGGVIMIGIIGRGFWVVADYPPGLQPSTRGREACMATRFWTLGGLRLSRSHFSGTATRLLPDLNRSPFRWFFAFRTLLAFLSIRPLPESVDWAGVVVRISQFSCYRASDARCPLSHCAMGFSLRPDRVLFGWGLTIRMVDKHCILVAVRCSSTYLAGRSFL